MCENILRNAREWSRLLRGQTQADAPRVYSNREEKKISRAGPCRSSTRPRVPSFRNAGSDMHLRACQGQSRPGLLILNSATFAETTKATATLLSNGSRAGHHADAGLNLPRRQPRTLLNSGTSNPPLDGIVPRSPMDTSSLTARSPSADDREIFKGVALASKSWI